MTRQFNYQSKRYAPWQSKDHIEVQFDKLPKFLNLSEDPKAAWGLVFIGSIFSMGPLIALSAIFHPESDFSFISLLIIACLFAFTTWPLRKARDWFQRRHYVLFREDGVKIVRHDRKSGLRRAFVPYHEYQQILQGQCSRSSGGGDGTAFYQTVELVHSNPDWCVPLYKVPSMVAPDREVTRYSRLLSLPVKREMRYG